MIPASMNLAPASRSRAFNQGDGLRGDRVGFGVGGPGAGADHRGCDVLGEPCRFGGDEDGDEEVDLGDECFEIRRIDEAGLLGALPGQIAAAGEAGIDIEPVLVEHVAEAGAHLADAHDPDSTQVDVRHFVFLQ